MSIRLIDEIYSELHNGEKPPYTNARGLFNYADYLDQLKNYFFVGSKDVFIGVDKAADCVLKPVPYKVYEPPKSPLLQGIEGNIVTIFDDIEEKYTEEHYEVIKKWHDKITDQTSLYGMSLFDVTQKEVDKISKQWSDKIANEAIKKIYNDYTSALDIGNKLTGPFKLDPIIQLPKVYPISFGLLPSSPSLKLSSWFLLP